MKTFNSTNNTEEFHPIIDHQWSKLGCTLCNLHCINDWTIFLCASWLKVRHPVCLSTLCSSEVTGINEDLCCDSRCKAIQAVISTVIPRD